MELGQPHKKAPPGEGRAFRFKDFLLWAMS